MGNVPEQGPVLLVGNHSGGNVTPDTMVFTLAFSTYFGVERRFYQLAHNLVLSLPWLGFLRRFGTVAASPRNAERALRSGAALLVYPGGDHETHRPSWQSGTVDFAGRRGFVRLALDHDVPIVPVVAIGGQETALFLSQGEGLARSSRARPAPAPEGPADLDRRAVGPQRRRRPRAHPAAGEDHDRGAARAAPARAVRPRARRRRGLRARRRAHAGDARRARRGAQAADPRLDAPVRRHRDRRAAAGGVGLRVRPGRDAALHGRRHPLGGRLRARPRSRRPLSHAHAGASAEIGGLVEVVEYDEPRDLAWTSVTGIDQRGRWRLRARSAHRTHVELRLSYGVSGDRRLARRARRRADGAREPPALAARAQASGRARAGARRSRRPPGRGPQARKFIVECPGVGFRAGERIVRALVMLPCVA